MRESRSVDIRPTQSGHFHWPQQARDDFHWFNFILFINCLALVKYLDVQDDGQLGQLGWPEPEFTHFVVL